MGEQRDHSWPNLGSADGGSLWRKANDIERAQAIAVVGDYTVDSSLAAAELAKVYRCSEWMVRQARWLALVAGYLQRTGDGFAPTPRAFELQAVQVDAA